MKNIDEVIIELDKIIDWAEKNQSTDGYFAALYRRMTIAVKEGIANNQFVDGPRMVLLDIVFAKRYLEAFENKQTGKEVSMAWQSAFSAEKTDHITVIQHLLLGINAHINLDLGIAASQIATPESLESLEKDFNKINIIIANLIDDTKLRLSHIWLPFRIFTSYLDTESDGIVNFSIKVARSFSWESTKQLVHSQKGNRLILIDKIDKNVAVLANRIINPSRITKGILMIMKWGERGSIADKIKILK